MIPSEFDKLVDYLIKGSIKGKMCNKSAEYARNNDKLYNFKRSAQIDKTTPEDALRGMDLKHRTSISDMLSDLYKDNTEYLQEVWEEKITDHINYMILLYALLAERYGWEY